MTHCVTCEIYTTTVMCTACEPYYFITKEGTGCVNDCWNDNGNSFIAIDRKKCVANCYIDSLSYGSVDST